MSTRIRTDFHPFETGNLAGNEKQSLDGMRNGPVHLPQLRWKVIERKVEIEEGSERRRTGPEHRPGWEVERLDQPGFRRHSREQLPGKLFISPPVDMLSNRLVVDGRNHAHRLGFGEGIEDRDDTLSRAEQAVEQMLPPCTEVVRLRRFLAMKAKDEIARFEHIAAMQKLRGNVTSYIRHNPDIGLSEDRPDLPPLLLGVGRQNEPERNRDVFKVAPQLLGQLNVEKMADD